MNQQSGCPSWIGGAVCPAVSRLVRDSGLALAQKTGKVGTLFGITSCRAIPRRISMLKEDRTGPKQGYSSAKNDTPLERVFAKSNASQLFPMGPLLLSFAVCFLQSLPPAVDRSTLTAPLPLPNSQNSALGLLSFRGLPDLEEALREESRQFEAKMDSMLDAASRSKKKSEKESGVYASLIREVWEVVDINYLDVRGTGFSKAKWATLRDEALAKAPGDSKSTYRIINEMLAKGLHDPYSRLVKPQEFDAMKKYDMSGIGVNVGTAEDFLQKTAAPLPPGREDSQGGIWILGLLKDSLADRAGLQQGDEILEIDGQSVAHATPFQAATMMKGNGRKDAPKEMKLRVRRIGGNTILIPVPRQSVSIPSPVSADLESVSRRSIGFIKLSSFNARAQEELVSAISKLERDGATELVLDLRNNRGGLVQEGIEVAKVFLEGDSTIVMTKEGGMKGQKSIMSSGPAATRLPLTILVNQNTASTSEIVAGALKDNCRAVLAGSRTYGKGLIQSVYALSDGSGLVLTVGKYLSPGKVDIDREGIQPDFKRIPPVEKAQKTLQACRINRKS